MPEEGFGDDDEAAREFGRQVAMDALLRCFYRSENAEKKTTAPMTWITRVATVAAVLMIGATAHLYFNIENKAPSEIAWNVEPRGEAEYAVVEPFRVRLDSGELLVPSHESSPNVLIETEHASATTTGGTFRIRTEIQDNSAPFESETRVTRIEVMSGVVTLTTPDGTVVGRAKDVLVAEEGTAPKNLGPQEN